MLIAGPHSAPLAVVLRNLGQFNPHPRFAAEMVPALWAAAQRYGLDGVVLVGQAGNETAWGRFARADGTPGTIDASYHNPCGLKTRAGGADTDPAAHWRAPDWATGARGHAEHLSAYLGRWVPAPRVDPRWDWVWGRAPISHVEELTGSWATQPDYGRLVLRNATALRAGATTPMTVHYIPRSEWDDSGEGRLGWIVDPHQFVGLVVHHTVTSYDPASGLDGVYAHMDRLQHERPDLGVDVPYSWVVMEHADPNSCYVAEGRGEGRTGAHTYGFNSTRYGVSVVGNYVDKVPTPGILEGIRYVGRNYLPWASIATYGHGDMPDNPTACPGGHLEEHLPELQPPFPGGVPVPTPTPKRKRRDMLNAYYRTDPADPTKRVELGDGQLGVAHVMDFAPVLAGGVIYHRPMVHAARLVKFLANGVLVAQNYSKWGVIGSFTVPRDIPDFDGNVGGPVWATLLVPADVEYCAVYYAPAV